MGELINSEQFKHAAVSYGEPDQSDEIFPDNKKSVSFLPKADEVIVVKLSTEPDLTMSKSTSPVRKSSSFEP